MDFWQRGTRGVCCPKTLLAAAFAPLLLACAPLRADDWPQWRGPRRDGVWREDGIVESIPGGGLPIRWRARILNGWSGPAVANGRVFVTDHNYKSNPEVERVVCFDEQTGERLWSYEYPCPYGNMEYGNGPRATPTVHEGLVYTLGTMGHLACLTAEQGELVWMKEPAELGTKGPRYGVSASPLIEGDLVVISSGATPGGTAIAFDCKSGQERWRALKDRPAYSSPIVIEKAGRRQMILWTGDNVNSLDPATGEVLWQVPYKAQFDPAQATATPVVFRDKMLLLAAWNRGSMMLQLDEANPGAEIFWKTRSQPTANTNTPVFQDEKYIYTIVGDGALCCLNAANGDEIWRTREATSERFGGAHIVVYRDRYFLLNQQGHLIAARMTPDGYHELGRIPLIEPTAGFRAAGPVCWGHPAFANRHVFARNDRELICMSMAAESAIADQPGKTSAVTSTVLPGTTGPEFNSTSSVAVSPDGKIAAVGTGWGLVRQIGLASGEVIPSVDRHNDWVCAVSYSSDGKFLASAGGSEFTPERNGGKTSAEIKIWDRRSNSLRGMLAGHENKIFAAVFSPDGKTLATGAADKTVRLWDIDSMQVTAVLSGHADAISSLAWSADGRMLASAAWDHTVRLWDALNSKELATLAASDEELLCVALSPDGRWLAAGGSDWTVKLWDIASARTAAGFNLSAMGEPTALTGHRGAVYSLAFSPDSRTLASGSGDETIRLWNAESGTSRAVLKGHRAGVTTLAFTPDGKQLISGALDGPVRIWRLDR